MLCFSAICDRVYPLYHHSLVLANLCSIINPAVISFYSTSIINLRFTTFTTYLSTIVYTSIYTNLHLPKSLLHGNFSVSYQFMINCESSNLPKISAFHELFFFLITFFEMVIFLSHVVYGKNISMASTKLFCGFANQDATRFFISYSIFHLSLRLLREDVNFRLKVAKKSLTG